MAERSHGPPGFRWLVQLLDRSELSDSHLAFLAAARREGQADALWVASDGQRAVAWDASLAVVLDRIDGTQRNDDFAVAFVNVDPEDGKESTGAWRAD